MFILYYICSFIHIHIYIHNLTHIHTKSLISIFILLITIVQVLSITLQRTFIFLFKKILNIFSLQS
jgi:hypothetical protein